VASALDSPVTLSSDDIFAALPPVGELGSPGEHLYQVVVPKFHAPGTHWYHPHIHGSTALHVVDGMAGALIIEEEGDAVIPVDQDLVLLAQEVTTEDLVVQPDPDLAQVPGDQMVYNCSPATYRFTINGHLNPSLTLLPGELQRWRFINATATTRGFIQLELRKVEDDDTQTVQDLTIIAFDGVSFHQQPPKVQPAVSLGSANRVDLLVQLDTPGTYQLWKKVWRPAQGNLGEFAFVGSVLAAEGPQQAQVLATITVAGTPVANPKTIPAIIPGEFPNYLQPITDDLLLRTEPDEAGETQIYNRPVVFGTYKAPITQNCNFYMVRPLEEDDPGGVLFTQQIKSGVLNPGQANPNPRLYQVNGLSFTPKSGEDFVSYLPPLKTLTPQEAKEQYDQKKPYNPGEYVSGVHRNETIQVVKLNTCEEWIIYNYTDLAHPFHIHMVPFQVVEVYNPNLETPLVQYDPATAPWHDTYPIAPFKYYEATETEPDYADHGYIKIRLRFTDFWGKFVFHCHVLNHEDQGMMQSIYVLNDDDSTGNNPFTQVNTSTVSGPGVSIGTPGALPANYYPPSDFEPILQFNREIFPPQVQVTSDGQIIGITSDPMLRAW
jgi:FtsP/CotA-like multicopper oxidase with cupredoxin domain